MLLARHLLPELLSSLAASPLRLGQDVLITYLAGVEEVALAPAGLEVLHLDYYTLGRRATKLLFRLIDDRDRAPSSSRVLVLPGMAEGLLPAEG